MTDLNFILNFNLVRIRIDVPGWQSPRKGCMEYGLHVLHHVVVVVLGSEGL